LRQFVVLRNPVARSRVDRPYVLVLQHERIPFDVDVIVAPLERLSSIVGRQTPILPVLGVRFQLILAHITYAPAHRLRGPAIDNLQAHANEITRALDYLFNAAG
jgi:hypothetical protein